MRKSALPLEKNASVGINCHLASSAAVKANCLLIWMTALLQMRRVLSLDSNMSQFKPQFCCLFAEGLGVSYNNLCSQASGSLK